MIHPATIALALAATPAAAAPITLAEIDPLTRGICEQLAINAQCEAEVEPYQPKVPVVAAAVRPEPRPDWCETAQAWRFTCFDMEGLYGPGSTPAPAFAYYGPGRPVAGAGARSGGWPAGGLFGGGGTVSARAGSSAHSSARSRAGVFVVVWPAGGGVPERPVDRPDEPEVIALPGAAGLLAGALAVLMLMKRTRDA